MTIGMNESEGLHRLAESVYKNLIDGFSPSARQLIVTGKAYFKALNGTAVAGRAYLEALSKLAENARQRKGATSEIGDALVQIAEVQKEIQSHQDHAVSEFYAQFLMPLENNLEQDGKTLAIEQKKYLSGHKSAYEPFEKAQVALRKYKKKVKTKTTGSEKLPEKEQQIIGTLNQCQEKLDEFRREGLRLALLQERKRYCFILDRLCAIIRSSRTYHSQAQTLYSYRIDEWTETSRDPETLPEASEQLIKSDQMKQDFQSLDDSQHQVAFDLGTGTIISSHSSDFESNSVDQNSPVANIISSNYDCKKSSLLKSQSEQAFINPSNTVKATKFQRSITLPPSNPSRPMVRAVYSYISSGDHQLSFIEGDRIALLGERNKGWQYGENLRSNRFGWFPVAYTVTLGDPEISDQSSLISCHQRTKSAADILDPNGKLVSPIKEDKEWKNEVGSAQTLPKGRPQSMFGENVLNKEHSVSQLLSGNLRMTSTLERTSPSSPPPLPLPPHLAPNLTQSFDSGSHPPPPPPLPPPPVTYTTIRIGGNKGKIASATTELNKDSSNSSLGTSMISTDSGFFNNDLPPPPPDYDEDDGHGSWVEVGSVNYKPCSSGLPLLY